MSVLYPRSARARCPQCLRPLALGLLLLTLLAGCAPSSVRTKGFQEARSTKEALEQSFAPQRWAVVVGVPRYQDPTWSRLKYTVQDASEVARVLREPRYGGFHKVILLTSAETTTRDGILEELRRLRTELRRQDTLLVYFSGHGSLELSSTGSPSFYLASSDSRTTDLWGTALELTALRAYLDALKPQRKVLILDACFAGTGKSRLATPTRVRLQSLPDPFLSATRLLGQSEALLLASALGGMAQEDDQLGHGTYTHFLLQALTGSRTAADVNSDGAVTAYEAHDFARQHTVDHTRGTQIPEGFFRVLGQAEMYLSGTPGPELARTSALVYAYGLTPEASLSLKVDGALKGTFPRTVPVEPGLRRLVLEDARGQILAQGELNFQQGQIYPLGFLLDTLQGPRRLLGLELGSHFQSGPLAKLWGTSSARVGVLSGYRVRRGGLSGLTLGLGFGLSEVREGDWRAYSPDTERQVLDAGARLSLRRPFGPLQLGAGWHLQADVTGRVRALNAVRTDPQDALVLLDRWLTLQTGPVFSLGIPLGRALSLRTEARASLSYGAPAGGAPASSFLLSTSAGLELGF